MDERDRRAAAVAVLRVLGTFWAFWAFVLVAGHLARVVIGRGPAGSGPFAGLGPADVNEIVDAARKGRAVSNPALAGAAAQHARDKLRAQGRGRYLLAGVIVLRIVTLVLDPPGSASATAAYGAVVTLPLLVLLLLAVVGYRRAGRSEELNRRLEGGVR